MKYKFVILIVLAVGIQNMYSQQKESLISYKIYPKTILDIQTLKVVATFPASQNEKTNLTYPNSHWGEKKLKYCIQNISVKAKRGEIEFIKDSLITIHHKKGLKTIQLTYNIIQDTRKEINYSNFLRPIVQPEYFHVFSSNLFIMPDLKPETKINLEIEWKGFDKEYAVHNSFGSNQKNQSIKNVSLKEFKEAVFIGGDYRIHTLTVKEKEVYLASRGNWIPFTDQKAKQLLEEIIIAQRTFWDDFDQQYYTIIISPMNNSFGMSCAGTGLTNSFTAVIANNNDVSEDDLIYLFNHEMLHNWIGITIRNENEEQQYWFSEGFTEYFNFKIASSFTKIKANESYFISKINKTIREIYTSTAKTIRNNEITYDTFWNYAEYEKIPYNRGALFAFFLDLKITKESNGNYNLDDVMRVFLKDAKNGQLMNHSYFIKTINKYLTSNIEKEFEAYIENGELLPWHEIFDNNDFEHETSQFTIETSDEVHKAPQIKENEANIKLMKSIF